MPSLFLKLRARHLLLPISGLLRSGVEELSQVKTASPVESWLQGTRERKHPAVAWSVSRRPHCQIFRQEFV